MRVLVSLNGSFDPPNGVVFELASDDVQDGLFAAFSGDSGRVRCNLGRAEPFRHAPPGDDFRAFAHLDDAGSEGWSVPKKKKKSKQADSDDADEPEREATPEPDAGDVTGRITFLLTRLIRQADLNMITTRICKDHIRASFEDGDAVCAEHKDLIKETIGKLINERAGQ
jgi:hypothetical protein